MILETTNLRSVPAGMGKSSEMFPSGLFATPWRFTGACVVDVYPVTMPPARSDMRAQFDGGAEKAWVRRNPLDFVAGQTVNLLSAPPAPTHLCGRSTVAGCVRRAGSNPAALNRIHGQTGGPRKTHESVPNRAV